MTTGSLFLLPQVVLFVTGYTVEWKWSKCDSPDAGEVDTIVVSPNVPTLGDKFSGSVTITLKEDVTAGKVVVDGHRGFVPLSGEGDICKSSFHKDLPFDAGSLSTDGFQCPQKAGSVTINVDAEVSDALRWAAPSADANVKAYNQNNHEIGCVNISYEVKGWPENKKEETTALTETTVLTPIHSKFVPLRKGIRSIGMKKSKVKKYDVAILLQDIEATVFLEAYEEELCTPKEIELPLGLGSFEIIGCGDEDVKIETQLKPGAGFSVFEKVAARIRTDDFEVHWVYKG